MSFKKFLIGAVSALLLFSFTTTPAKAVTTIRIGIFANVTHASALVAVERGTIEARLNDAGYNVQFVAFNAGPAAIEAMKAGSIDMSFIGPNPAVSGFISTRGSLLRIVSGVTSGGAAFITKPSITTVADLKGKTFATPQLGNTQDVAIRAYLRSKGLKTSIFGGGDVTITPTENATTLSLFKAGSIDGAWVPEPWASRLVLEGNGRVFLDESSLWTNGAYATTVLIAKTAVLTTQRPAVKAVINAIYSTNNWMKNNRVAAKDAVQAQLLRWSGKKLSDAVIDRAWTKIEPTLNPIAVSIKQSAIDASKEKLITLGGSGIKGIMDLRIANEILAADGKTAISAAGLGLN